MKNRITLIAILATCLGVGSVSAAGAGSDPSPGFDAAMSAKMTKQQKKKKQHHKKKHQKKTKAFFKAYALSGSVTGQPGSTVSIKVSVKKFRGKSKFEARAIKALTFDNVVKDCGSRGPGVSSYSIRQGAVPSLVGKNRFMVNGTDYMTRWLIKGTVKNGGKKVVGTYTSTSLGCRTGTVPYIATVGK